MVMVVLYHFLLLHRGGTPTEMLLSSARICIPFELWKVTTLLPSLAGPHKAYEKTIHPAIQTFQRPNIKTLPFPTAKKFASAQSSVA